MTQELAMVALARTPHPEQIAQIMELIEEAGGSIERHGRVRVTPKASGGSASTEGDIDGYNAATALFTGLDLGTARSLVRPDPLSSPWPDIDVNIVPPALFDPDQRKLLVLDMDSTFIQQEAVDLLAEHAGAQDQVQRITERAMNGEIDFVESLRERVAALEGLPEEALDDVGAQLRVTIGADVLVETFHRAESTVGVVSGGFRRVLEPLMRRLGIDHYVANELEIRDGRLTGRIDGAVVDGAVKAEMLRRWAQTDGVSPEQVIAVGDGANDAEMLQAAGLGVAFNAKPVLRSVADAQVNIPNLDAVRFFADL